MSPTLPSEKDTLSLNIEVLSFLLSTNDPNILGELSIEESRYQRAIDAIKERTRIHIGEVQPLLDQAGIIQGGGYSFQKIQKTLGNRLYTSLQQSTKQIIELVDSAINSLQGVGSKLKGTLEGLYPEEKFIGIAVPDGFSLNKGGEP